jgi:hypothetical protein
VSGIACFGAWSTIGGVSSTRTMDHPTVRGDLSLTTDNTGKQAGDLRSYGPYGETLTTANDGMPDNQPGQMD